MTQFSIKPLPDVADDAAHAARALDWVGMAGIDVPLRIQGAGGDMVVPASVDVAVDLRSAETRGIHMSRLYLRLQDAFSQEPLSAAALGRLLDGLVESQRGLSGSARVVVRYGHLLSRPALASDNRGWKNYPVTVEATQTDGKLGVVLEFTVVYSSTCPASAALSRQLNAERFSRDFASAGPLAPASVAEWLASERGMAGTPHAQRSRARVRVELRPGFEALPLAALVDAVEAAVATPVQTAVKREDEQAFARLNAENLMFCEDAARRVAAALSADPHVARFRADVEHLESLHAHDAVASVSGTGRAA